MTGDIRHTSGLAEDADTSKTVDASRCVMTQFVLPNDTNPLGNLMGGRLMHLMDICAAVVAQRHAGTVCVTASVDSVDFRSPIRLGEIVYLEGFVNRAFNTSMEIEVQVWAENPLEGTRRRSNSAFFTFVAVDDENRKVRVPRVQVSTRQEQKRFEDAARRRELRLLLAGRIGASEASRIQNMLSALWNETLDE
jgi:acyl-CoA hydrolase